MSETTVKWNDMNASNDKDSRKFLLLPGDLGKITVSTATPVYVSIIFDEVPASDRIYQVDLHYDK